MPTSAWNLHAGDMRDALPTMPDSHFDAVITDPPYDLNFMGRSWDRSGIAFQTETWAKLLRVLKPGAHLVAFGGSRTFCRMACAIEDAGFEVRDTLMWLYGSGFPKGLDVAKAIDKEAGHWRGRAGTPHEGDEKRAFGQHYERTDKGEPITPEAACWAGWNTALKPAFEPIILARKPLIGTVAANVLEHGTGGINVDACRVGTDGGCRLGVERRGFDAGTVSALGGHLNSVQSDPVPGLGRWPANVLHDGSDAVEAAFAAFGERKSTRSVVTSKPGTVFGGRKWSARPHRRLWFDDSGSASRFFYCAKASKADRAGSKHPTVKPLSLMRWLITLVTPPGGHILEPFAGSGTTMQAAIERGFQVTGIEMSAEYCADIRHRLANVAQRA